MKPRLKSGWHSFSIHNRPMARCSIITNYPVPGLIKIEKKESYFQQAFLHIFKKNRSIEDNVRREEKNGWYCWTLTARSSSRCSRRTKIPQKGVGLSSPPNAIPFRNAPEVYNDPIAETPQEIFWALPVSINLGRTDRSRFACRILQSYPFMVY